MPSKPKSSSVQNGSLAWILYRKQPWPVLVKRIYPKKLTYNFLPVSSNPIVFNTTLKNARPFMLGDKLPSGATAEQQAAYDIAMELALKVSNAADHASSAESAVDTDTDEVTESKSAKTRGTAPATAMAIKSSENDLSELSDDSDNGDVADKAFVEYAPGDVAIVDTIRGSWPVRVKEVVDGNSTLIYELFPPSSAAQGRVATDKVTRFPVDEIETLIASSKQKPNLCKAFQNVKAYLGLSDDAVEAEAKSEDGKVREKNDEGEQLTRPKRGKSVAKPVTKASSSKTVVVPKVASNCDGKAATSSGASKKKSAEKLEPLKKAEKMEVESKRPARKRRHDVDEIAEKEHQELTKVTDEDEAELSPDSSGDNVTKKRNGRGGPVAVPSGTMATKERRPVNTTDDVRPDSTISVAQQANGKFTSALKELSPIALVTTRGRLGLNRGMAVVSPRREESVAEREQEAAAPAKSTESNFLQMLLSHDTSAHMNAIWTGDRKAMRNESSTYAPPTTVDDMDVRFQPFGRFFGTVDELHESVTEIRKWTQLCTKLPKMALLTELHYISNVVLPEACIFALSKTKKCSLSDATDKFERMISEENQNKKGKTGDELIKSKMALDNGTDSISGNGNMPVSRNGSTSATSTNGKLVTGGLHELVLAASMMAKSVGERAATLSGDKSMNFDTSSEGGAMYIVEEDVEDN